MNRGFRGVAAVAILAALPGLTSAQTVKKLRNIPPDGAELTFQLTDGTVLAQGYRNSDWWVLTPDETGSYVNGTWAQGARTPSGYSPYDMASQVLADGRVLIEGGEYNSNCLAFTNLGVVYDPVANAWTRVDPPKGWENIGDAPSVVLPNGTFLLGDKLHKRIAELDPRTMKWASVPSRGKNDFKCRRRLDADAGCVGFDGRRQRQPVL